MNTDSLPRLYSDLSDWWPLLSAPADYAEEAADYQRIILERSPGARTLLELGSGGGNNASFLKHRFAMTLVDRAPGMLAVSRGLNPECEHVVGDMRDARLDRAFDAVFIHDAICYLTAEADLRRAIETAFVHCRPGGVALFCPDCTRESFRAHTSHGGHDRDGRGLRYLAWTYDPDPSDTSYLTDMAYLLRDGDQTRCVHDRHVNGLFPRDTWLRLIASAGFRAEARTVTHSEIEPGTVEMFVGVRT